MNFFSPLGWFADVWKIHPLTCIKYDCLFNFCCYLFPIYSNVQRIKINMQWPFYITVKCNAVCAYYSCPPGMQFEPTTVNSSSPAVYQKEKEVCKTHFLKRVLILYLMKCQMWKGASHPHCAPKVKGESGRIVAFLFPEKVQPSFYICGWSQGFARIWEWMSMSLCSTQIMQHICKCIV